MAIDSDRTFCFQADRTELWAALRRVDDYQRWWPWLRRFEATGLDQGERWRCTVNPPVPYALHFEIELVEVVDEDRIEAAVTGDIAGRATLTLRAVDDGSELRLVSSLAPRRPLLSVVTAMTPWLAQLGHDWVLDTGRQQFQRDAL